jgi:cell division protease FtsH
MNFFIATLLASCFISSTAFVSRIKPIQKSLHNGLQKFNMIEESNIYELLKYKNMLSKTNYNKLLDNIENQKVSKVFFTNDLGGVIIENADTDGKSLADYSITTINPFVANSIVESSKKNHIDTYFIQPQQLNALQSTEQFFSGLLQSYIIPFIFLTFIITLFRGQSGTGGMPGMPGLPGMPGSNDINKDKIAMAKANISLASFAGSAEIFEECTEVVSYLKNNTIYKMAGAEIPRGILLEGPPGTGKTLLAKAIASEADANFISVAASEFVELFVGMGAAKIRAFFKKARDNKPCILFIDEIDAVGRQRGAGINMANDEREQTLNQLLAEMDGFADNDGILVIAATNRKDVLDAALLRPGRFDRIINVPLPDRESRKAIFKVHSKNKTLDPSIDYELIAELTGGFSGAQIKNLLNEAAIFAARKGNTTIGEIDLLNSLDKALVGIAKRNDTRSVESKLRIAVHETGHALLTALFNDDFELKKVTMQATYNGAGGYTVFNEYQNISESGLYTKNLLKKRLIIGMGGKAAENIFYGEEYVSVGAIQDLKQANSLAQRMIGNYGMGNALETFYNENVESDRNPFLGRNFGAGDKYSNKIKEIYDMESIELVDQAYKEAKKLLVTNRILMNRIVEELVKKYTLYGKDVMELMEESKHASNTNYNY